MGLYLSVTSYENTVASSVCQRIWLLVRSQLPTLHGDYCCRNVVCFDIVATAAPQGRVDVLSSNE